jgi:hydrogenase nickel incorporation protein HypA/HybF
MHELSIVMSILDIAKSEAIKANASQINEIELEIGTLSGIDMDSFNFAWREAIRGTILENSNRIVFRPQGKASCLGCDQSFDLVNRFDPCPFCNSHFINIIQGKELKVKALVVN